MSRDDVQPVVCVGGGGHARVVMEAVESRADKWRLIGFTDPRVRDSERDDGLRYLGQDSDLATIKGEGPLWLVLGVGSIGTWQRRRVIVSGLEALESEWAPVIHRRGICSDRTSISEGAVILGGAVVNPGSRVGAHAIINTAAVVEHDCEVGDWAHIGPGACLGGSVTVGEGTHIGLGSAIREGVSVGRNSLVGVGSVVIEDVEDDVVVVGNPARVIRERPAVENER